MKKWEPLEIIDEEEKIVGLKGSNYHLHLKDLEAGNIPIEIQLLQELCTILEVDYENLETDKFLRSLESIDKRIQIVYNSLGKIKRVKEFAEALTNRLNTYEYIYEYNEGLQQFIIRDSDRRKIILSISYEAIYHLGNSLYEAVIQNLMNRGYIKHE